MTLKKNVLRKKIYVLWWHNVLVNFVYDSSIFQKQFTQLHRRLLKLNVGFKSIALKTPLEILNKFKKNKSNFTKKKLLKSEKGSTLEIKVSIMFEESKSEKIL